MIGQSSSLKKAPCLNGTVYHSKHDYTSSKTAQYRKINVVLFVLNFIINVQHNRDFEGVHIVVVNEAFQLPLYVQFTLFEVRIKTK